MEMAFRTALSSSSSPRKMKPTSVHEFTMNDPRVPPPSPSAFGLRERTTSQSSVDLVFSRERTISLETSSMMELAESGPSNSINPTTTMDRRSVHHRASLATIPSSSSSKHKSSSSRLRRFVLQLQSQPVPLWLIRYWRRRSATASPSDAPPTSTPTATVYWIQGLDRVLFPPAACCAEAITLLGWQPPRYLWYMLSGALCDVCQLLALYLLHRFVVADPTTGWALAFTASIALRHSTHRYLVFGDYVGGYRQSLGRMYLAYSVSIGLSTLVNFVLARVLAVHVLVLALLTMVWTGLVNYFILQYCWHKGGGGGGGKRQIPRKPSTHAAVETTAPSSMEATTTSAPPPPPLETK